jgi:hypothetical protein
MTRWPSPDQNSTLLGQPQHFVNDNAKAANDDKEGERKCLIAGLEHFPVQWNRTCPRTHCLAHVLVGKPVATLPERALSTAVADTRG